MKHTWLLLAAIALFGADDQWSKVANLKSGSELKIFKKGVSEPVTAIFDQVTEDRVVFVVKNAQTSLAKSDVDRIDARPPAEKGTRKLNVTSTSKQTEPDYTPRPQPGVNVPGTSSSSNVSIGGSGNKADFEVVYRRGATGSEQNPQRPPSAAH